MHRRHRPREKLFCAICGKPKTPWCSIGHKWRLPARDRRKLQPEE